MVSLKIRMVGMPLAEIFSSFRRFRTFFERFQDEVNPETLEAMDQDSTSAPGFGASMGLNGPQGTWDSLKFRAD